MSLGRPEGYAGGGVLRSGLVPPGEPLLTFWASVPWRVKRRGEGLGEETEAMVQFWNTSGSVLWAACPRQPSAEFGVAQLPLLS